MDRITGTLKFYSKARNGNAVLTGKWDNGKDKMFCGWDEAEPLRDAKLVYEHPVETWDNGDPRWVVNGEPEITLEVEWKDKKAFTKICVNGETAESTPGVSGPPRAVLHHPLSSSSLAQRAEYFGECLAKAAGLWNEQVTDDVLYKTAFTLYKG